MFKILETAFLKENKLVFVCAVLVARALNNASA